MVDYQKLYNLYVEQQLSSKEIGNILGVSGSTILHYLKKHNIPARPNTRLKKPNKNPSKTLQTELINKRFGLLVVVEYNKKHLSWLCNCDCGNTAYVRAAHLNQGRRISCGCKKHRKGRLNPLWKGHGELSAKLYSSYKFGAERRGLEFTITVEELWQLLVDQNYLCSLTKIPIKLDHTHKNNTASPDRIDNNKGYILGNVQWLHKIVNEMKWNYSQEEFIKWCKLIAANN